MCVFQNAICSIMMYYCLVSALTIAFYFTSNYHCHQQMQIVYTCMSGNIGCLASSIPCLVLIMATIALLDVVPILATDVNSV